MDFVILIITIFSIVGGLVLFLNFKVSRGKNLSPGAFGIPLIGETISVVKAYKYGKANEWMGERTQKYGPVFKTSMLGSKVVVLTGQVGSKFVFEGGDNGISLQQPKTVIKILGKNSLFELSGARHKLIRGAIVGFFKPENIQNRVSQMDSLIQQQLLKELEGKDSVKIVDLMKKISFNVTWSIFFGLAEGNEKESVMEDFKVVVKGTWTVPLHIPGTAFYRALKAKARIHKRLLELVEMRKTEMEKGMQDVQDNFLTRLVSLRDENGEPLTEEAILDIFFSMITASHDSTAILMTLFARLLSSDAHVYNRVLREQEEAEKKKGENEERRVSWKDILITWSPKASSKLRFFKSPSPLSPPETH